MNRRIYASLIVVALVVGASAAGSPAWAAPVPPGASSLTVDQGTFVSAGGASITLSGTAPDGTGATVTVSEVAGILPPVAHFGSTVVGTDGAWSITAPTPAGPDGQYLLEVDVPGVEGVGYHAVDITAFRRSDTATLTLTSPAPAAVLTSAPGNAIETRVALHDLTYDTTVSDTAWILQAGHQATASASFDTTTDPAHPVAVFEVPVRDLANGPAELVVESIAADATRHAVVAAPVTISLTSAATVTATVSPDGSGFPFLTARAVVANVAPDTVLTASYDAEPVASMTPVSYALDNTAYETVWSVFSIPQADTAGPQVIADGPHVLHVHLTSRGKTTGYDVPFTVDTTPRLSVLTPSWTYGATPGTATVTMRGRENAIHLTTTHWSVVSPATGVSISAVWAPPSALPATGPGDAAWASTLVVSGWNLTDPLVLRLSGSDLAGSAVCTQAVFAGWISDGSTCDATAPGPPTITPTAWGSNALGLDFAVPAPHGAAIVDYLLTVTSGPLSTDPVIETAPTGAVPAHLDIPAPALGTSYWLHAYAETVIGRSLITTVGPFGSSSLTSSTTTAPTVEGALRTVTGKVSATSAAVPLSFALAGKPLSVRCTTPNQFATTAGPFATVAGGATYSLGFRPRMNATCKVLFAGDLGHGLAPSSATFAVKVAPALGLTAARLRSRLAILDALHVTVSSVGRYDRLWLQRYVGRRWLTIASQRNAAKGTAGFSVSSRTRGTATYRVLVAAGALHVAGVSRAVTVTFA